MNKPVTVERIKKAIAHIEAARDRDKRMERDGDIIQSLATYGLRSAISNACGVEQDPLAGQRIDMDMTYLEAPRSPENFHFLMARWRRAINRYCDKLERIHDIQRVNNISGLAPSVSELGPHLIEHPWQDDGLVLIEPDLAILNEHKPRMVERWADYALLNGLSFYKKIDGGWELIELSEVHAAMPFYQWAQVWEHGEAHLLLGNGLYTDAPGVSIWFCAHDRIPSL